MLSNPSDVVLIDVLTVSLIKCYNSKLYSSLNTWIKQFGNNSQNHTWDGVMVIESNKDD